MSEDRRRLVLVGPGRAGRAFARSWTLAGGRLVVAARDVERARRELPVEIAAEVVAFTSPVEADVLLIAVSDDAIGSVARELAPRTRARFVYHFSGALPAAALAPIAGDAHAGSLHPLRAFTGASGEDWSDAFVAVEGDDGAADAGIELCRRVGARPHRLPASGKPLYHAAATLAAGGTASLVSIAARLWAEAGLDEEEGRRALAELASGAIAAVERSSFDRALTGPVARRDVATVRLHRDALAAHADILRLYAMLASETLSRTGDHAADREIAALLGLAEIPAAAHGGDDENADSEGRNEDRRGGRHTT